MLKPESLFSVRIEFMLVAEILTAPALEMRVGSDLCIVKREQKQAAAREYSYSLFGRRQLLSNWFCLVVLCCKSRDRFKEMLCGRSNIVIVK